MRSGTRIAGSASIFFDHLGQPSWQVQHMHGELHSGFGPSPHDVLGERFTQSDKSSTHHRGRRGNFTTDCGSLQDLSHRADTNKTWPNDPANKTAPHLPSRSRATVQDAHQPQIHARRPYGPSRWLCPRLRNSGPTTARGRSSRGDPAQNFPRGKRRVSPKAPSRNSTTTCCAMLRNRSQPPAFGTHIHHRQHETRSLLPRPRGR